MDTFIQNKTNRKDSMLHELWILGMPTIVEQLLQTVVSYVDTAMVGQIGAIASAAIGLTATVNWLFNGMFFAVSMGMLSYIARYTGEGDVVMAHRTSSQALWVVVFLGIAETIIALLISPVLPQWMGASREIWKDASEWHRYCLCFVWGKNSNSGSRLGCERSCFCYSAQSEHRRNCNFYCCDA